MKNIAALIQPTVLKSTPSSPIAKTSPSATECMEADSKLDPVDKDFKPANAKDAEVQAQCRLHFRYGHMCYSDLLSDNPEDFLGAPISVQLVCRRFREEECIGLTGLITEALKAS